MENNNINFIYFKNQSFKFKVYFYLSIILSILLFFLDTISIVAVLPVLFNYETVKLSSSVYSTRISEILIIFLESLNHKFIIIFFLLILFFRNFLSILQNLLNLSFDKYQEIEVSKKVFDLNLRKNFLEFYKTNSNDLLKDLRESIGGYCLYVGSFLRLFSELILLLFLVFFLFYISFLQTLIILTFFIFIFIIFTFLFFKISERVGKITNTSVSQLNLNIIELSRNFIQVILLKLKEKYLNKYLLILEQHVNSKFFSGIIKSNTKQFLEIIVLFFLSLSIILLSSTTDLSPDLPLILMYLVAGYRILPLVNNITANSVKMKNFHYSFSIIQKRINEYNSKYLSFVKHNEIKKNLFFKKNLKLKNISFKYKNDHNFVFKNLNLEIYKNDMIGVLGKSGCGKSTLLRIIMGIITPDSGTVMLDNKKLEKTYISEFQNLLGFLSQEIILVNASLKENIALGETIINNNKVKKSLMLANCNFFTTKLKKNLNYIISEYGKNFSAGQLQRIALARMLYFDKEIFLLDEPTSALDKNAEKKFIDLIKKFKNYKTIIIVTHRKNVLKDCNKIYEFKNKTLSRVY